MSKFNLNRWLPKSMRTRKSTPLRNASLSLQTLEARDVPNAHTFTNPAGGFWSTPGNWMNNSAPQVGESSVTVSIPNGQPTTMDISGLTVDNITFSNGGSVTLNKTLTLNGGTPGDQVTTLAGGPSFSGPQALNILGNAYFNVANGSSLYINPNITGTGGLVTDGGGVLELRGTGLWQGETNIFSGAIALNNSAQANNTLPNTKLVVGNGGGASGQLYFYSNNQLPDAGNIILRNDGLVDMKGKFDGVGALELNGGEVRLDGGSITVNTSLLASGDAAITVGSAVGTLDLGSATLPITVNAGKTLTVEAKIIGTGGINLDGGGTFDYNSAQGVSTANIYTGTTFVKDGTLILDNDAVDGAMAGSLIIGDGVNGHNATVKLMQNAELPNSKTTIILANGFFDLNGFSDIIGPITTAGGVINTRAGTLTFNGDVTGSAAGVPSLFTGNFNLGGADRTFNITDGAAATDLHINGSITGTGGIIKDGPGSMIMDGPAGSANTYTGNTTVMDGKLGFGYADANAAIPGNLIVGTGGAGSAYVYDLLSQQVADGKTIVVLGDGKYDTNNFTETIGGLIIAGGNVTTGSGKLVLTGDVTASASATTSTITGNVDLGAADRTFNVVDGAAATDLVINGVISGTGGLIQTGDGVMELQLSGGNTNTFTGQTWIKSGTLNLNTVTSDHGLSGLVKVGDGSGNADSAVLNVLNVFELRDDSTLAIAADGRVNIPAGIQEDVQTLSLNGGELHIDGEFRIRSDGSLNADGTAGSVIDGAGALNLNAADRQFTITDGPAATDLLITAKIGEFNVGSGFIKDGAGTLEIGGTKANTYTGATTIQGGTLLLNNGASDVAVSKMLNIDGGTVRLAQPLEIPDDATVNISIGGKLDLNSKSEGIGKLNLMDNGVSVTTGTATLTLNGDVQAFGTGLSPSTITGNIALPADRTFTVADTPAASDLIIDGIISGAGSFIKDGGGTLEIKGLTATPNTFGATTVKDGTLLLNDNGINEAIPGPLTIGDGVGGSGSAVVKLVQSAEIATNKTVTILSDGLLDLSTHNQIVGGLTMTGGMAIGSNLLTLNGDLSATASANPSFIECNLSLNSPNRSITVADGPAAVDLEIDGAVAGGGFIKDGLGSLVLAGANSYSGASVVNAGSVFVNGDSNGSAFTLNGGLLGGFGSIGAVTAINGTVAPGTVGPATLTTKNFTLAAAALAADLKGTSIALFDQIKAVGEVNLTGGTLNLNLGYSSKKGDSFRIIDNDGSDAVVGQFANVAADGTIKSGYHKFQVNYAGGDGNDVVVSDISGANTALVGTHEFAAGAADDVDAATLYNANGSERYTVTPFASNSGGVRTAVGDFNGDGIGDLVVGTGPGIPTQVRILDGVTQMEIFSLKPFESALTGGVFVAAGDMTGDGLAELVVTPDEGGGPRCRVFRGGDFAQIADFFGIEDPNFRGGARAAVADVTGDGLADLLVAAGFGGGPRLAEWNGISVAAGAPKHDFGDFFVFEDSLRNGVYIAGGDLDGDGFADLIAGGGPGGGPRTFILSGKDLNAGKQTVLANYFAGDPESRGGLRIAVHNLDDDGQADLVTGAGTGGKSHVAGYLGAQTPKNGTPPSSFEFDAFNGNAGFNGGVYVG